MAKIISLVFHPLLLSLLTFSVMVVSGHGVTLQGLLILGLCLLLVDVFPLLYVYRMKRNHLTSHWDIPERLQRSNPLLFSVFLYAFGIVLLILLEASLPVKVLMFAYMLNTSVIWLITRYWKISIHAASYGGSVAALAAILSPAFYWLVALLPILLFARVRTKSHTPMQVIIGFVLALLLTSIQFKVAT